MPHKTPARVFCVFQVYTECNSCMKIIVKAKPNSKKVFVQKITQPTLLDEETQTKFDVYKVAIKEPPVEGKANRAIIKALAEYFDVAPSLVSLASGPTSREKIFEIDL